MSQEDFDKLPMLLLPHQAMQALGCNEETLRTIRSTRPEVATLLPGMTHYRYVKRVIAELAKLKYH